MITRTLKGSAAFLAFALSDLPLQAADRLEKLFPVSSSPRIAITNYAGSVRLHAWSNRQVRLFATKYSKHVRIDLDTGSNWLRFATELQDRLAKPESIRVDYEVSLPHDSSVELRSNSGNVEVEGIRGQMDFDVMNASILVRGTSGAVTVKSLGGRVEVQQSEGTIHVTTVSGEILLEDVNSQSLNAATTTGNLFYVGDFLPAGKYEFSSQEGSISIRCPPQASVEWNAKSVRGGIESNLPIESKRHYIRRAPSLLMHTLTGTLNSGAATVNLFTVTGKIRIYRK